MNNPIITLAGHLTDDIVFENGKEIYRCNGGIENVNRALIDLGWEQSSINLAKFWSGEVEIEIDRENCTKRSFGSITQTHFNPPINKNSEWIHISYMNHLSMSDCFNILENNVNKDTIFSADLCYGGRELSKSFLNLIDYLFVSEDELDSFPEIVKNTKGWIIVHYENGSYSYKNLEKKFCYSHDRIKNVNVLGAGDYFAASVIDGVKKNKLDLEDSIVRAHNLTTNFLKNRKQ